MQVEKDFIKADSVNLPKVDSFMIANFFASNPDFCSAEFRNVKTTVSSRQSYGDDAIGYVQLKRDHTLCTVKCRICPEHKVRQTSYSVSMVIDEKEGVVKSVQCHDCPASLGGCKHSVAFLMWVHRRSEEPACTSTECYWKKSKLAKVGTTLKFTTVKQMKGNSSTDNKEYARITASKAFNVSRCKTTDGSLIALLMGAKVPNTPAMDRGRKLEGLVRKEVEKQYGKIEECGLIISRKFPMVAGSPDGILKKDVVVEIKCPTNEKTFANYICNGKITTKFAVQVLLQMYVSDLKKGLFCVADWDFEKNNKVHIIPIEYDETMVNDILCNVVTFWKNNIYSLL
ncbi:hypothetical protein HF086_016828 [Spodoptera exigua]|uniref:YqaJ viral recombinase domain-containing protein n=1 Tax=Spodoptera exigua TaxID=7107 RepID=A0A922LZT5_SPOEX|nr:hypothetical protein HF086_016828 [Spodoptera exigua]